MAAGSDAATVDPYERLKEYATWGGADSTYQWALNEIERLREALKRLASAEGFKGAGVLDHRARMRYAEEVLRDA